ncbi:hypothetical protein F4818DRAFT_408526 [Hypoxylon cercidicola]|nr:hypothetical protein F4818DRAFT_408526 [Hypoxylon cercidicola]
MLLRVSRSNRLQASRNQVWSNRMATHGTARHSPRAPFTSTTASAAVRVDQTKKSNDPSQDLREEHLKQATKTTAGEGEGEGHDHPAKQPDPQPSPSKSTGIRSEGPGSTKSGEGTDRGVHKEKDIEGGQHDNYPFTI